MMIHLIIRAIAMKKKKKLSNEFITRTKLIDKELISRYIRKSNSIM